MAGEMDPDCRAAFPWDEGRWDRDLLAYLSTLTRARGEIAALRSTDFRGLAATGMASAYLRGSGGPGSAIVALNAGDEAVTLEFAMPDGRLDEVALDGALPATAPQSADGVLRMPLPARAGRLFEVA
jgi:hypothetical protein